MRFYALSIFILINFSPFAFADNFTKTVKLLNAGDYKSAHENLKSLLEKSPDDFGVNFLAARYYATPENPAFKLDSAYFFAGKALEYFPGNTSESKRKKYAAFGVRQYTIENLLTEISDLAFEHADTSNTLENWEYFIKHFPQAEQIPLAIEKRNELAYEQAMGKYTFESFKEFMEKYPNAGQVADARSLYESLLYKRMTENGSWLAYKKFMDKYPNSPHYEDAVKNYQLLLFREFTHDGSLRSFENYIKRHAQSPYSTHAQDSIFAIITRGKKVADYEKFIRTYPDNRNVALAWKELFEVYNLKRDKETLAKFKIEYPDYPFSNELTTDIAFAEKTLIPFEENELYGFRDSATNEVVVPAEFSEVMPFSEGLAAVAVGDCENQCMYGYINKGGRFVIPPRYNEAEDFENGFAIVGLGNCYMEDCRYGIIDRKGNIILPIEFDEVYPFSNGLSLIRKRKSGYGFADMDGKIKIPVMYKDAGNFSEGVAPVKLDSLFGYIDEKGKWAIEPRFSHAGAFGEGIAPAAVDGKWGYVDRSGNFVIEPKFGFTAPFKDGLAKVIVLEKMKGLVIQKEKMIDRDGNFVTQSGQN